MRNGAFRRVGVLVQRFPVIRSGGTQVALPVANERLAVITVDVMDDADEPIDEPPRNPVQAGSAGWTDRTA